MSTGMLINLVVIPAITLGLLYHPILSRLSLALVTPYAKADLAKRGLAASIDAMAIVSAFVLYRSSNFFPLAFLGAAYIVLRDAVAGRSLGKFLCGLVVIDVRTGRPCGQGASIMRNLLFLVPGANLVAGPLEVATIVRDPQGQRLGDRLGWTQVVEGFGARDVAAAMQRWWLDFVARLERQPRRRRGAPVRVRRESVTASRRT